MSVITFREAASNAIRFWERARIAFNVVLATIVIGYFVAGLPSSRERVSTDLWLGLFVLAVLANVAFCAAYPIDIFAQYSTHKSVWLRVRWAVLIIGILFAGTITRFMVVGMFENAT
jgi:hypothetical protein